ncbi:hypothetical protein B0H66DRAFT_168990 [Apodospora peruviana]|uniref:Uncharacterized protein n=1 Tax=Apodospora peruviana TaxID=516989 RepID=A0AAE0IKU0_9PEZI|nr:hypothetical protein B0H66DRAFT_168990 [Apodospora peruviana]
MDTGNLAHMAQSSFNNQAMSSGLASRRGGQGIKPLSFDSIKSPTDQDNGVPTPRTSRSHLLAGLRTAPKSAMASTFANGPNSPSAMTPQARNRGPVTSGMYDSSNMYNGPKTSLPRYGGAQQQGYNSAMGFNHQQQLQQQQLQQQQYTAEQILAPQLQLDEHVQEQIDPNLHAQLLYTNAYLSEQQQRLQQQLKALQIAAQQFQGINLNGQVQMMQQGYPNVYQQQAAQNLQRLQELQNLQNLQNLQQAQAQNLQVMMTPSTPSHNVYNVMYDPATGQQTVYVDQAQAQAQLNAQLMNQQPQQFTNGYANMQQPSVGTPRLQVSPPPLDHRAGPRNPSPPRRFESPIENPAPLPPPSANAFRRGHKKSSSTANGNKGPLSITTEEAPRTVGPKTASFPLTPMTAGYGPGQGRAGEHPVRQPRNPPSMDELKAKPTAKHDGSKNFVTRTRRSAINNLVRAGLERRKEARSTGSISPISESTEEMVETPMTDNDSESGRSGGSGSLVDHDDAECSLPSSRTSTGSWGAIGSDRPSSRQKVNRDSVDSTNSSDNESSNDPGSFASLLKKKSQVAKTEVVEGQRKAMLVLTSAEKRKVAL